MSDSTQPSQVTATDTHAIYSGISRMSLGPLPEPQQFRGPQDKPQFPHWATNLEGLYGWGVYTHPLQVISPSASCSSSSGRR